MKNGIEYRTECGYKFRIRKVVEGGYESLVKIPDPYVKGEFVYNNVRHLKVTTYRISFNNKLLSSALSLKRAREVCKYLGYKLWKSHLDFIARADFETYLKLKSVEAWADYAALQHDN
jgi:hypothetical protein